MDDIKLLKIIKNWKTLLQVVRICSQDVGMAVGIEKYGLLKIKKTEKTHDGRNGTIKLEKKTRMLGEKETYKYLGILEANIITQVEMKEKN